MRAHPLLKILFLLYVAYGGWNWFVHRPVRPPDGILAPGEPQQNDAPTAETHRSGRWLLTERAQYRITARILGIEHYHVDMLSSLVPLDLALGWGPMSDNQILRSMEISQANRFYFWRASADAPISREIIIAHSANTHVIPKNPLVAHQLSRLRPGQVVTLDGVLVDARRDDGATITTSMSRTDTGAGACEVVLVNAVSSPP